MSKKYRKYIIGTIVEIANELVKNVAVTDNIFEFINCDFTTLDITREAVETMSDTDVSQQYQEAHGWYGIKSVDTGFDSAMLELVSDYYGGGAGNWASIDSTMNANDIAETIIDLIVSTLSQDEASVSRDSVIVAELDIENYTTTDDVKEIEQTCRNLLHLDENEVKARVAAVETLNNIYHDIAILQNNLPWLKGKYMSTVNEFYHGNATAEFYNDLKNVKAKMKELIFLHW